MPTCSLALWLCFHPLFIELHKEHFCVGSREEKRRELKLNDKGKDGETRVNENHRMIKEGIALFLNLPKDAQQGILWAVKVSCDCVQLAHWARNTLWFWVWLCRENMLLLFDPKPLPRERSKIIWVSCSPKVWPTDNPPASNLFLVQKNRFFRHAFTPAHPNSLSALLLPVSRLINCFIGMAIHFPNAKA